MKKARIYVLVICFFMFGCSIGENEETIEENELVGSWSGAIQVPDAPLHIQLSLNKDEKWTGLMTIPAQGVKDFPIDTVTIKGSKVVLITNISGQQITFDGEYDEGKTTGTFRQEGQAFPFEITKTESSDPGELLSIDVNAETLHGELALPAETGPHPIVLIIPGSGPTDRNGNTLMGENNSLKFLAEQLAEKGVASLRFDKRGAGKNATAVGDGADFQFNQYVEDAVEWMKLLQDDDRFSDVGIIGHSEGSLVGMLASQETDVNIFISLAGAGRSIDEVLYDQLKEQLPDSLLVESKEYLQRIKQGEIIEDIPAELMSIFSLSNQPFLMSWMQYDPAEEIAVLTIPTLIINGDNDLQVPASEAELLAEAKSTSESLIIEKMNHILKESSTERQENLATYSDPTLPLADGLIDGIVKFFEANNFVQ